MISIIIPTYNRKEILLKTLCSIERQNFQKDNFEVIVIDDGSSDNTEYSINDFKKNTKIKLKYFQQNNSGPSNARNLGVEKAVGKIVLFSGDDTLFHKNMLYEHNLSHQKQKGIAVLGSILWSEDVNPNEFMNYLAPHGPQFHYNTIKNINNARFTHFYTCNISLEKKLLQYERFDDNFKFAALEDIELGLRLEKNGLKIIYNKNAVVYHCHHYEPGLFYKRMINMGKSITIFQNKYKHDWISLIEINKTYAPFVFLPFGLRLFKFTSDIMRKSLLLKLLLKRGHWFCNISYFYALGIFDSIKENSRLGKDIKGNPHT